MGISKFIDFVRGNRFGNKDAFKRSISSNWPEVLSDRNKVKFFLQFQFIDPKKRIAISDEEELIKCLEDNLLFYHGCAISYYELEMDNKYAYYVQNLVDRYILGSVEYRKSMEYKNHNGKPLSVRDILDTDRSGMDLRLEKFFSILESIGVLLSDVNMGQVKTGAARDASYLSSQVSVIFSLSKSEFLKFVDLVWIDNLELPKVIVKKRSFKR